MIADEIRFGQASEAQLALAAEVCYRVYKESALRRAFLSPEMVLQRWRWVIDGNPTRSPFGVPAWVATLGDDVVGHFGLIPATAVVDGRAVPVAWGRDFFVAPSAQGAGVGPRLVGAAVAAVGTVLVAGLNPRATRAYLRVGFVLREPIPFYLKVLRPAEFAEAVSGRLPSWLVRAGAEAATLWGRRRRPSSDRVRVVDSFSERFDEWWSVVERRRGNIIHRSSATMNWRYREHPSHRHTILELERHDRLAGIAVVRAGVSRGLSAGVLVELLVEPGDRAAAAELIAAAERTLLDDPPDHALIRTNTFGAELGRALIGAGFVRAPSPFRWMVAGGDGLGHRSLFLNGGDSDMDFV